MDAWIGRLDGQPSLWIAAEETGILWYLDNFCLDHISSLGIGLCLELLIKPKTIKTRQSSLTAPLVGLGPVHPLHLT